MSVPEPVLEFKERGYAIVRAAERAPLNDVRQVVYAEAMKCLSACTDAPAGDCALFFNQFHQRALNDARLNEYRMNVFRGLNARIDVAASVRAAFGDFLLALIGQDIAAQKVANLVIQQPGDTSVPPAHRDAPPNSPYEIVAWIPLVDCYGSKGIVLLDHHESRRAVEALNSNGIDYNDFHRRALAQGRQLAVPYGSAVFFAASLVHAIPINVEHETRWSLNLRFKNIFSPYGNKGFPDFFRILELSPTTQRAIAMERQRRLGF